MQNYSMRDKMPRSRNVWKYYANRVELT